MTAGTERQALDGGPAGESRPGRGERDQPAGDDRTMVAAAHRERICQDASP